jgi:hypothetical protein
MKIPKLKLKKVKDFLKKAPRGLAEKSFPVFLGLFVLSLIFGAFVFYKYNTLIKEKEILIEGELFQFKEEIYKEVLQIWKDQEIRFQTTDSRDYPNPFRP